MDCKKADKSILHSFTSLVGFVICALQVYSFFFTKNHCLLKPIVWYMLMFAMMNTLCVFHIGIVCIILYSRQNR